MDGDISKSVLRGTAGQPEHKTEQAGMTVYLYRVAEKQAGVYVLNEKFQASGADVSGGGSREAAITLTNFVKAQGIQPYRTGTGSGKHVVFGIFRMERLSTL